MRPMIFCILFFTCVTVSAQKNSITVGNADSVYSNILHEKRKVWVSMPDTTSPDGIFYPQRYPVVYLLDGDENSFASVAIMLRQMGGGSGNTGFPQMILVGIPNTDRTRDLTPFRGGASPAMDSMSASQSGGGEKFISFIQKELMPHIDSSYPTAPYSVLMGHSFGGLTAMYILLNHTKLFNAYLASDPSMWWANQQLLKQAKTALHDKNFAGRSLFLAMANTMQKGMDTIQVKQDSDFTSLHIRSIMQLGHYLNANKQNGLAFTWKYYPDYNHGTVSMVDQRDALQALFAFYSYNLPFGEFFNPAYKGDTLLAAHYKNISRQMGYTVSPPEQLLSALAHQLTDMKQFDRAYYYLNLNVTNYPKSFNAWGRMGDLYVAKGDKQKAIEYYSKALTLKDDTEIRAKLNALKEGK